MNADVSRWARRLDYCFRLRRSLIAGVRKFADDRRGTVAVITALALPVLLGTMGVGVEISYWYLSKRAMQNAADAAAIAAATNAGSNYAVETKAVAAQYGFVDDAGNTRVTVSSGVTCPTGRATCYSVAISRLSPLFLSQVVGFDGNVTLNGSKYTRISATAVADRAPVLHQYCVLALNRTKPVAILGHGTPDSNLAGCGVMSNTSATCTGKNGLGADYADAVITSNGCGLNDNSGISSVADPYSSLASNIPDPLCDLKRQWSGDITLSENVKICGDLQLTGDTILSTPSNGAVLVIENGQLDLDGHTLQTASGSALTVVFKAPPDDFTGSKTTTPYPTGGGTLDIAAPTSGDWMGVAIYQDPNITTIVDIAEAGNSPTWNITGLVYLPKSSVTVSGAVNKSGKSSCFALVVDNITINGKGSIFAQNGCKDAGLTLPQASVPGRGQLVN